MRLIQSLTGVVAVISLQAMPARADEEQSPNAEWVQQQNQQQQAEDRAREAEREAERRSDEERARLGD